MSRHIRTEKCSWSQCWFVDIKKTPKTRRCTNIWFDFFGTTGISGIYAEEGNAKTIFCRVHLCTCVQCCFLQEIHKSNCCLMNSYHTRGQNCSKQTDMEEDRFCTTRTTRTWMWAVYLYHVLFFWNLNQRDGRHQTSRSCSDFLAFAGHIEFLMYRRRMNSTEGDKSGAF